MLDSINSALSGLQATTGVLAAMRQNDVNDDPDDPTLDSASGGDLLDLSPAAVALAGLGVDTTPSAGPNGQATSNIDLVNELATLTRASILYGFSGRLLQASNSMLGSLLDVSAGDNSSSQVDNQDDG